MDKPTRRERLRQIIFGSDTPIGKGFDLVLLALILFSTIAAIIESIEPFRSRHQLAISIAEWTITILFTVEYAVRLYCVRSPAKYARSFFGLVDLLAILPSYLGLLIPGSQYLRVVRILRMLRVFRLLKLSPYLTAADTLVQALQASSRKILIFLCTVLFIVIIVGAVMYVVEGDENGFSDIPTSVYWTIVTITTVGYGDIAPQTHLGKFLASMVMLLGYSIIAVPTGIVTVELGAASQSAKKVSKPRRCPGCDSGEHVGDASFCRICGAPLPE